jgi:hypothetical protein
MISLLMALACNQPSEPETYDRRDTVPDFGTGGDEQNDDALCSSSLPSARVVRRLSLNEYANTVYDLLGVSPTTEFAADGAVNGYDNDYATLSIGSVQADEFRTSAEDVASRALDEHWNQIMPCTDETRDCALKFVTEMGTKAFRRPLSAEETDAYIGFFDDTVKEDGFHEAIQWVLTAFLESPYFLYRIELGSRTDGNKFALSDWEIASELSYLLWGTMPDDRLFELAAAGELHTEDQIATEVQRMLLHAKAGPNVGRFTRLWLPSERVRDVVKSEDIYPGFTAEIRDAMIEEIDRDVQDAYWDGKGVGELLTADYSWMSPQLADYYGVEADPGTADAGGWMRVDLSDEGGAGILTRGALMASLATPSTSSPIRRGKLIRENLLCQTMPPPPNDIQIDIPEYTEGTTTRELYENYTLANKDCAGCHQLMDLIGFGFENYDGNGVYRTTDQGKPVDASGEIVRSPHSDASFGGPNELGALLADSEDVQFCYVRNWLEYATGAEVDVDSPCALEIAAKVKEAGGSMAETLAVLAATPDIQNRIGEVDELDGPAPRVAE